MAATVNWNPNRYGSTKRVLSYNASTGNYSVVDQDHSYTGVNYNFTALPTGKATTGTTTGTTTKTTGTTQDQTTQAFGDVKPWWWNQQGEGKDNANVFSGYQKEKEPVTELSGMFAPISGYAGPKPSGIDRLRHQFADFTGKTGREWEDVDRAIAGEDDQEGFIKKTTGFVTRPIKKAKKAWKETFKPLTLQAIDYITKRPGANKSFRGVAGLYDTEIELMRKYGSVGATDMNPTGDTRKDDAGFNIVSFAMNYNQIGTNSRRHNALKLADIYEKGSQAWKDERNKIRAELEQEKKTKIKNDRFKDVKELEDPKAVTGITKPGKNGQTGQNGNQQSGGHYSGRGGSGSGPQSGSYGVWG